MPGSASVPKRRMEGGSPQERGHPHSAPTPQGQVTCLTLGVLIYRNLHLSTVPGWGSLLLRTEDPAWLDGSLCDLRSSLCDLGLGRAYFGLVSTRSSGFCSVVPLICLAVHSEVLLFLAAPAELSPMGPVHPRPSLAETLGARAP